MPAGSFSHAEKWAGREGKAGQAAALTRHGPLGELTSPSLDLLYPRATDPSRLGDPDVRERRSTLSSSVRAAEALPPGTLGTASGAQSQAGSPPRRGLEKAQKVSRRRRRAEAWEETESDRPPGVGGPRWPGRGAACPGIAGVLRPARRPRPPRPAACRAGPAAPWPCARGPRPPAARPRFLARPGPAPRGSRRAKAEGHR